MTVSDIIRGRGALGGVAEGPALISRRTITGWGGVDVHTGIIVEPGHPLEGICLKGGILILDGSKGSNGWSVFFHGAQASGFGPAGLVFPRLDSRTAAMAAVLNLPLVTDLEVDPFERIEVGDRVRVDGNQGLIMIFKPKNRLPIER